MYTNRVFGTAKCVLFIYVSLHVFQGVLNEVFNVFDSQICPVYLCVLTCISGCPE